MELTSESVGRPVAVALESESAQQAAHARQENTTAGRRIHANAWRSRFRCCNKLKCDS